jgi:hypothetical protein
MPERSKKFWVVAVDMGYGHQRAAIPLEDFAEGGIIDANTYPGIPASDKLVWEQTEKFYNFISRQKGRNWLGNLMFGIFDMFQSIDAYYPLHWHLFPTIQLRQMYARVRAGWGKHLIEKLAKNPLPLFTTFFGVAHMAEYWHYPAPIYCLTTDSDISRAWAPMEPAKSKVIYLASTLRAASRLQQYGVHPQNIRMTGFPLPDVLVGENGAGARAAVIRRLPKLDPMGEYLNRYGGLVKEQLGISEYPDQHTNLSPTHILFAVGGAAAQMKLGEDIITGLTPLLQKKSVRLTLVAGTSEAVRDYFTKKLEEAGLQEQASILFADSKTRYFKAFNEALATADILWTKPSELSFYGALGLPIIIAPPVGAQEIQNRKWLLYLDAGFDQLPPTAAYEWLPDILEAGTLARVAMNGYLQIPRDAKGKIIHEILS